MNLAILIQIVKVFRKMKGGHYSELELEEELEKRGHS
jgi:high-affinity nickel-transport protein